MKTKVTRLCCVALAVFASLFGCNPHNPPPQAANFELPDLDGKKIQLADFKGKVVLLNFWGTTCAPCQTEIPWLVDFEKQYQARGFEIVAVSMYGDSLDVLKPYVHEHSMEKLKVLIGNDEIAGKYGLMAFPTTFIIDKNGNVSSRHQGLINREEVRQELIALLGSLTEDIRY